MLNAIKTNLRNFQRDADGALLIFGLVLFVLMLMMGGFAIDLMRYENTRTNLQNTLDRSVLAAASITNTQPPHAVVRDYMQKAGLADQLANVTVTEAMNSRAVKAVGVADTHPIFLHMLGIDKFDAKGRSQAEQSITNIEIVLVLDVSGSMGSNNKINNLRTAASEFVDTVLANDVNNRVSISIVPYNAQVNTGPDLANAFYVTNPNGVVDGNGIATTTCFEPSRASFGTSLAISRALPLSMSAYADYQYASSNVNSYVDPANTSFAVPKFDGGSPPYCRQNANNVVRLPNNNATVLKAQINALEAQGNTSITLGMKWGATMLDPSMRPAYAGYIASGKVPATLQNRPFDYGDRQAMKFVILMTDGEHVAHKRIVDGFKYGPSGIFKSPVDGQYSVYIPVGTPLRPAAAGTNEFYVPQTNTWQATPWQSGVQLGWQDVWKNLKTRYVAWQFFARPFGTTDADRTTLFNNRYNAMVQTYASASDMDVSLNQTCNFVKDQGVIVFGIAFEAPAVGQTAIRNCSTDPAGGSHYFAADGLQIRTAFQTIAANMSMLKLTQ